MVTDIWKSFTALPLWVRIWIALFLLPTNLSTLFFWGEPSGAWVTFWAIGGLLPNAVVLLVERGFSKALAISHLVFWVPLLFYVWPLAFHDAETLGAFQAFLRLLITVNIISLVFDARDGLLWINGERTIAKN